MEFTFETNYDQKTITTMVEALRKTIRKKRNKRTHIFGWIIVLVAILLVIPTGDEKFSLNLSTIINLITAIVIVITLLFEDKINAYIARKRMLTSMSKATTIFEEEKYTTTTELGKTEFNYSHINTIAETDNYFIFIFDISHAQIYDKNNMTGGNVEEFRTFIKNKINKDIEYVK